MFTGRGGKKKFRISWERFAINKSDNVFNTKNRFKKEFSHLRGASSCVSIAHDFSGQHVFFSLLEPVKIKKKKSN